MLVVEVNIRIGTHLLTDAYTILIHTESSFDDGIVLLGNIIVPIDTHHIVAAQQHSHVLVGYCQPIVSIYLSGIKTLLIVLHRLSVGPSQPVTLEDAIAHLPVCIAMVHIIDISMILMAHLVPRDLHPLMFTLVQPWWQGGITIGTYLERAHSFVIDTLLLC